MLSTLLFLGGGGGLVTKSCPTLVTPRIVAYQAPLLVEFPRQEYWSGLVFPSPGDLPNSGIKPRSPALQADSLPTELPGNPYRNLGNSVFLARLGLSSWKNKACGRDVLKQAHLFIMLCFLARSRHCVLYTLNVCVNSVEQVY